MQAAMLMAVSGIVYVIGIPIACVIFLRYNRRLIKDETLSVSKEGRSFRDTYGQLFNSYNASHWYFESVEMIKKMILMERIRRKIVGLRDIFIIVIFCVS